jgi:hypothetical protein
MVRVPGRNRVVIDPERLRAHLAAGQVGAAVELDG